MANRFSVSKIRRKYDYSSYGQSIFSVAFQGSSSVIDWFTVVLVVCLVNKCNKSVFRWERKEKTPCDREFGEQDDGTLKTLFLPGGASGVNSHSDLGIIGHIHSCCCRTITKSSTFLTPQYRMYYYVKIFIFIIFFIDFGSITYR